jgi:hypothetical protein
MVKGFAGMIHGIHTPPCIPDVSSAGGIRGPVIIMRRRSPGIVAITRHGQLYDIALDPAAEEPLPLLGFEEVSST